MIEELPHPKENKLVSKFKFQEIEDYIEFGPKYNKKENDNIEI